MYVDRKKYMQSFLQEGTAYTIYSTLHVHTAATEENRTFYNFQK